MANTSPMADLPNSLLTELLTPSQRQAFLRLAEAETHPADTTILHEGGDTRGLWVVMRGGAEVVKHSGDGPPRVLAELGPGAVFGEMSFFRPAAHSAAVRAVSVVETVLLTADGHDRLQRDDPATAAALARAVAVILSERLRRMDDWVARLLATCPPEKKEEWADFRTKLWGSGWL